MKKFGGFLKKNIVSALFLTVITLGMLLIFVLPKEDISVLENRALAKAPELTLANIASGGFSAETNNYLNDHFPLRGSLLNIGQSVDSVIRYHDAEAEIIPGSSGGGVNGEYAQVANDILLCRDRAMEMFEYTYSDVQAYAASVNHLQEHISALNPNTRVFSMMIPTAFEFYAPTEYREGFRCQKNAIDNLYSMLSDYVIPVNVYDGINNSINRGEYVYFRTDHHWTVRGAYQGYAAFCQAAGNFAFYPQTTYRVAGDFLGTMYFSTMREILKDNPDYVEVFVFPDELSVEKCYGFADAALNTQYEFFPMQNPGDSLNKYLTFMGGDKPMVHMVSKNKNGRSLLIVKDSFSNAMAMFYLGNYQHVWLLDPRLTQTDIAKFCKDHNIDDVLVENYALVLENTGMADTFDLLRQPAEEETEAPDAAEENAAGNGGETDIETAETVETETAAEDTGADTESAENDGASGNDAAPDGDAVRTEGQGTDRPAAPVNSGGRSAAIPLGLTHPEE